MSKLTTWSVMLPALPLPSLSPNAYLALGVWVRAEERDVQRDQWLALLNRAGVFNQGDRPIFNKLVDITIRLTGTGRRTDPSNWTAHHGIKVLLDCLTQPQAKKIYGLGIIVDDSARYVSGFHVEWAPNGEPATEISIKEAGRIDSCHSE